MRKKRKPVIGKVIKTRRVRLQLKAEDIAEACNVSRSRVYAWEAQDYVFEKNLEALAEVLRISVSRLKAINGARAP